VERDDLDRRPGGLTMRLFGYELSVTKALTQPSSPVGRDGWSPIVVREPFTGAWQLNQEVRPEAVLANPTVYACITRIAQDIGKLPLNLVTQTSPDIWEATTNPAYSPVLRTPNHYQDTSQFIEQWTTSKLIWGNTYVLKGRDARGVVNRLYVLNPAYVTPLVAPDASVFYQLTRDDLNGLSVDVTVPAREIIHDRMNCLWHPLVGVPPLYAAALPAQQGLTIQQMSSKFFAGGANPGGLLIAPGAVTQDQADKLAADWMTKFGGSNVGKVAVLSNNLKYEPLSVNAQDSQLIEQQNKSDAEIAKAFGMPMFILDTTKGAPYANNEALIQVYHAECLQSPIQHIERGLEGGLDLPSGLGIEFDVDALIWMDTPTRTKAASDAIGSGAMTPNEARRKYFGLGPVAGGDTPYLQQQYWPLQQLVGREIQPPTPAPPPLPDEDTPDDDTERLH
jgi:HK97 family phage portal protein